MTARLREGAAGHLGSDGVAICPAVAVALALEELDRLKAVQCLPTPEALLDAMQRRSADFDLLAGVTGAYLRGRGLVGGCHE